ncbi:oxidoreductase [candidate division CSSED10-310 bacterium]|uniref:Oxidoreductase n=1 Tax=candidate division CSSED10-310 bacterium TaxID=2855610 RepID=A0ABV6YW75_UNCC1
MDTKIKLAINWAGACGGCDVSILDLAEKLLDVVELADIVYWPVALDFKRSDLIRMEPHSIDIGLFNGAVRTSEQLEDALLLRERCKIMVAFGSCASFGGIPGLANCFTSEEILRTVYQDTASTNNPQQIQPTPSVEVNGKMLTLPEFFPAVQALNQVVDVDYFLPGCPPPFERVLDLVTLVKNYREGANLPPAGTTLALDKALCFECPRQQRMSQQLSIPEIHRPHEIFIDPDKCFLEQGLICMGPATRGGCGFTCIQANMPCRGCFGPVQDMFDQGAEAISAIGSLLGDNDDYKPQQLIPKIARDLKDPLGTFYRFTLAQAILSRKVIDT